LTPSSFYRRGRRPPPAVVARSQSARFSAYWDGTVMEQRGRNPSQTFWGAKGTKWLELATNRCHWLPPVAVWIAWLGGGRRFESVRGLCKGPARRGLLYSGRPALPALARVWKAFWKNGSFGAYPAAASWSVPLKIELCSTRTQKWASGAGTPWPGHRKGAPMQGKRMRGESAKQVAIDVLRAAG
jgi:hypothetical protein